MIAILGWIRSALIAGLIAKAIMPGRDPGGMIITILLGIAGSLIGGFIGQPYSAMDVLLMTLAI